MPEISAELCGGPWGGRTGRLQYRDEPQRTLTFNLDDSTQAGGGLILPSSGSVSDKLTALYVRIEEKPRKVLTYDDNGRARSELGVRYRYDPRSPVQALLDQADEDAKLTAAAQESVNGTRKLLLADAHARAQQQRRDVERIGDLKPEHIGRLVSIEQGEPKRYGGHARDFTRDGGVVITLDGREVPGLVDDAVLLLDGRDG